jgi:hypothetical protein
MAMVLVNNNNVSFHMSNGTLFFVRVLKQALFLALFHILKKPLLRNVSSMNLT